ncbi:hypothetical protein BC829DRAFT_400269 [Chytridium lagenaria]|nr:hypothetical protein BC829DRAFT_400269 [Chytridium lagenaria]
MGQIQTLDKADRLRILTSLKGNSSPDPIEPWTAEKQLETLSEDVKQGNKHMTTCRKSGSLPTRDALRSRMELIGTLYGVSIDEDSISFMEQSLATHLKDVLSSILQKVRFGADTKADREYLAAREAAMEKAAAPMQVPTVRVQNTSDPFFPSGKPLPIKSPSNNSSPSRFSSTLAPVSDIFSRSNANTPPSGLSLPNSPHLSLKAKKALHTASSLGKASTSSSLPHDTTPNRIGMEDMLFSHQFTPALYTCLPAACDVAERMLGALDDKGVATDSKNSKGLSSTQDSNTWAKKMPK